MDWLINTLIVALVETASDRIIPPKDRSYISAPASTQPKQSSSNQSKQPSKDQNESSNSTPAKP